MRPKGSPKTPGSGRKKGTPNKKTEALLELLERKNFSPAEAMIYVYRKAIKEYKRAEEVHDALQEAALEKGLDGLKIHILGPDYLTIAGNMAKELMQYVHPKRKAIDLTSGGEPLSFVELMKEAAKADGEPGSH
jgi:hypothetical protein